MSTLGLPRVLQKIVALSADLYPTLLSFPNSLALLIPAMVLFLLLAPKNDPRGERSMYQVPGVHGWRTRSSASEVAAVVFNQVVHPRRPKLPSFGAGTSSLLRTSWTSQERSWPTYRSTHPRRRLRLAPPPPPPPAPPAPPPAAVARCCGRGAFGGGVAALVRRGLGEHPLVLGERKRPQADAEPLLAIPDARTDDRGLPQQPGPTRLPHLQEAVLRQIQPLPDELDDAARDAEIVPDDRLQPLGVARLAGQAPGVPRLAMSGTASRPSIPAFPSRMSIRRTR